MKLVCLLLSLLPVFAVAQEQKMSEDEKTIRSLAAKLPEGWNTASGAKFAEPFAKDADYVVVNGMRIKGKDVIGKAHQQIFDTVYKDTKIDFPVESVRFLRPDVAVVHLSGFRTNVDKTKDFGRATLVFVKNAGKWEIEAFQNTPILNPPVAPKQ